MATKKKKAPLPRRIRTGLDAAPTVSFRWFYDYVRLDVQRKDLAAIIRNYIRKNYKGEEQKLLLSGPEWIYGGMPGVAASIEWLSRGHEMPDGWNFEKQWEDYVAEVRFWVDKKLEKKDSDDATPKQDRRSPIDYMHEQAKKFCSGVDAVIDDWKDSKDFSMYDELVAIQASSYVAKYAVEFYSKQRLEIAELVNDKTKILLEAYSHLTKPEQKGLLAFYDSIIADGKKYLLSKKAQRKPAAPRTKSADKQVAKVKYCKASSEYKLKSLDPIQIIKQMRLYTFNVKDRTITEYISHAREGFQISGTTLKNFDMEKSRSIRLRKPEESLTIFQTKTWRQINKHWETLTTKTTVPNGRLNADTIILRVMDQ